jgi:DNA-binding transcriptional ArsR family regulator
MSEGKEPNPGTGGQAAGGPLVRGPVVRRPATAAEAKALAHPLRMRILRLCLDRSLTNKQLAEWLGKDPGTVLHHVRTLVKTGFLVPDEVRPGEKGALEKPYRATGKSWTLSLEESPVPEGIDAQAMLEAFQAELAEAGPGAAAGFNRLALTLNKASRQELESRVLAILDEFVTRPPDPDGEPYGLLFAMHRRSPGPDPGGGPARPPRTPPGQDPGSGGVAPRS